MARKSRTPKECSDEALIDLGRTVLSDEARAVSGACEALGTDFARAVRVIADVEGRLVVTGMGKANFVGQKISATFASTGTPSLFLHPADALHGDLGRVTDADVILALSHSGETDEMLRLIEPVKQIGVRILAITASAASSLGRAADLTIEMGRLEEAGTGLAPTTSTTVMMAIGDALAMAVLEVAGFSEDDFRMFHPAGALGRKLMLVESVMRTGDALPLIPDDAALKDVIAVMTKTPGRPGASLVVDGDQRLKGIFTDGDLRRLIERGEPLDLEAPVEPMMCANPKTVRADQVVAEAARVLRDHLIDQVPVIDDDHRPIGLLDIQDLLTLRLL